jgi:hypothetical protein
MLPNIGSLNSTRTRGGDPSVTLAFMDEFLDSFSLEHLTHIKISMPIRPNGWTNSN